MTYVRKHVGRLVDANNWWDATEQTYVRGADFDELAHKYANSEQDFKVYSAANARLEARVLEEMDRNVVMKAKLEARIAQLDAQRSYGYCMALEIETHGLGLSRISELKRVLAYQEPRK